MCYLFIITFLRIDWGTVFLIFAIILQLTCHHHTLIYCLIMFYHDFIKHFYAFMMQFPHQKATFLCKNTKKKLKNRNYRDKYD